MDIWLQTGNENRDRLIHALRDLGITNEDLEKLRRMDFTNPVPVFFFRESPRQIDFVTKINNISFEEAIKEARYFTLENRSIHVINYNYLIITNLSTNRAKDKADIEELERIISTGKIIEGLSLKSLPLAEPRDSAKFPEPRKCLFPSIPYLILNL